MRQYLKESLKYFLRSDLFIKHEIKEVEKLYSLGGEDIARYKEERFLSIFRCAILQSKFYKDFYSGVGININDIQSLRDIKKLPVLTKNMVRENFLDLLTVPRRNVYKANTSGTTGTPLTILWDYATIKKEQAYICVRRKNYGFNFGERLVSLRGHLGHKKFKLHIHISNTLFLSSYNISQKNVFKYFSEIKSFNPKAIEGYPSSLYNLCVLFKEQGLYLNIPLTFTSSETLYEFQRILIENILNTKIYDRYGCSERTISLAQNVDNNEYYEEPGYSIAEFQHDSVYTTSLINDSFPLIRYQINDRFNIEDNGDVQIVKSILGRCDDVVICKDGTQVGRLDHIFKGVQNIIIAQIVQSHQGCIDLNIVPYKDFSKYDKYDLEKNIHKKIDKQNIDVRINIITKNNIIYSSRNKFNLVISKIR